jgi:hypothetical protein
MSESILKRRNVKRQILTSHLSHLTQPHCHSTLGSEGLTLSH